MAGSDDGQFSRRRFLQTGLVSSAGGLAGCSDGSDGATTPTEASTDTPGQSTAEEAGASDSESSALDYAMTYRLPPGHQRRCSQAEPVTGSYQDLSDEVVDHHVESLRSSGCTRLVVTAGHPAHLDAVASLAEQLSAEVSIQFRYDFVGWTRDGTALDEQLDAVGDAIASLSQYATIDGRPVVVLPDLETRQFEEVDVWDSLLAEYGSGAGVVRAIREGLTTDGSEPYLVGVTRIASYDWTESFHVLDNELDALLRETDAVQNGIINPAFTEGESREAVVAKWLETYHEQVRALRLYADAHDIEYIPRVVPGFSDSNRGCPPQKHLPRDPERFRAVLEYAARYATTDRLTIESFNDWTSGTQLEPGSMAGTDYGEAYLEVAADVAQQEPAPLVGERDVYHVAADGSDWHDGSEAAPLATLLEGLVRAAPGATVEVGPGEYRHRVRTIRDGTEDNPITITGSANATVRVPEGADAFWIKNSHIRIRGITIDGLVDPERPDVVESYSEGALVQTRPPSTHDDYLRDIVIAPAGIGNAQRSLMVCQRTTDLEIGPLQIIGLAGAEYTVGDLESHVGEFVYLGQPPRVIEGREHEEYNWSEYPWQGELDQTRNVHIHHIDNSEGHDHSQLVNTKTGTRDVLIEYCTDAGGSYNTEDWNKCADVRFQSYDATIRWCILRDGDEHAIQIGDPHRKWLNEQDDPEIAPETSGTGHSIYGNTIEEFGEKALQIDTTAEEQDVLCGNDVTGEADADLGDKCSGDVPEGDGRGHLGGESPWVEN